MSRPRALSPSLSRRWKDLREDLRRRWAQRWIDDRRYLEMLYREQFERDPNLDHPTGFNEKILLKILHDRRPYLTLFADKLRVREYVRRTAPALRFPQLYGWADRAEELPFETLPETFVFKANHGSGWNLVVDAKSAFTRRDLVRLGRSWLAWDFTLVGREWAYRDVRRALYAEELLIDPPHAVPPDYKVFVFGGKARVIQVDRDRATRHMQVLYDPDWQLVPGTVAADQGAALPRPALLDTMLAASEALSAGVDFVRVDLYLIGGEIYFGELTSTPNKGLCPFNPPALDELFGSYFVPDDYAVPLPLDYRPETFHN